MRIYYYLLFRMYSHYLDSDKKNINETLYSVTITSTLLIYMIFFTSLAYVDFYFLKIVNQLLPNKSVIIAFMVMIASMNYWLFIKDKKFLNYSFKTDKKGGYLIIGFIVVLTLLFAFIANKNREKIFKEREKARIEHKQ